MLPTLSRPAIEPPGVEEYKQVIAREEKRLATEPVIMHPFIKAGIQAAQAEIRKLREGQSDQPKWLLLGMMRSPTFWLQTDAKLNPILRTIIKDVIVQFNTGVNDARVESVVLKHDGSVAPLPADQNNILMKRGLGDLVIAAQYEERIKDALAALG